MSSVSELSHLRRIKEALDRHAMVAETDRDGNITYANEAFCLVTGYAHDELIGKNPRVLNSGYHPPEFFRELWSTVSAGRIWHGEIRNRRRDGSLFWRDTTILPMTDETGAVNGYTAIGYDITARHEQMDELRRALARAEQLAKEAQAAARAKTEFLANMSHELRTPLNAVLGLAELLLDTRLDPQQQEFADSIRGGGETLLSLINNILDFSKIESGKLELEREPLALRDCVESALDLALPAATAKGLELLMWIDDDVPPCIAGDVTRLRQILVNLVNNAVKFTAKGEVLVSVTLRPGAGPDAAGRLHVSVRDTGVGIPPDRMDRLFKAFSQVDASTTRRFGGTGLGLAICARLVDGMGGRIWVETEPGRGSNFQFEIPCEPARMVDAAPDPLPPSQLGGRRVLLVDDNPTNLRILTHLCNRWGLRVAAEASGADALKRLERESVDLAILDVQMPDMNGIELAAAIRARGGATERLPLIALSSLGDDREMFRAGRFARVLTKPAKASLLLEAICAALAPAPAGPARAAGAYLDHTLATRHPLRVLLAEDNPINQHVARLMLQRFGYACTTVADGDAALAAASSGNFDVVLLDVQMPGLSGLQVAARLRELKPAGERPWLIAMTANAMDGDREECLAAGMDDYVPKPIVARLLAGALERAAFRLAAMKRSDSVR